jgi:calcineurin-like phosphoesterase family protein/purple acid phosphatase-like protein
MQFHSAPAARRRGPAPLLSSIFLAVALVSCWSTNESGRLAAVKTGDVSAPPVARIAPGEATAACANVTSAGPPIGGLARAPYLQRVTAHDAVVAWTSAGAAFGDVRVATSDGTPVATFPAAIDTAAAPSRGAEQWTASVSGLEPDTTYCYSVYQGGSPATAPTPLHTAPAAGAGARVQFLAFGDSGGGGGDQEAVLEQMQTVPFDFMIHTGDIAYDNGTLEDFEGKFFDVYAPLLGSRPIFPSSGNHDYVTADAAPFRQVFMLPENGGPGGLERWYSYDWGDVHFVALDTEKMGAAQAAWLEADLAANKLPWTIVYGHKPPHSSGEHNDDATFKQLFVPILEAHHVQLSLGGHDHDYERFQPINGVTYIVTGGGGRGVREVGNGSPGSVFSEAVIHFVVVTVEADTLTVHTIDGTGREFDSTVIHR